MPAGGCHRHPWAGLGWGDRNGALILAGISGRFSCLANGLAGRCDVMASGNPGRQDFQHNGGKLGAGAVTVIR
jgi:hypothetical protein